MSKSFSFNEDLGFILFLILILLVIGLSSDI